MYTFLPIIIKLLYLKIKCEKLRHTLGFLPIIIRLWVKYVYNKEFIWNNTYL